MNKTKVMSVVALLAVLPAVASGDASHYDAKYLAPSIVNFLVFFGGLAFILRKTVAEFFSNRRSDIESSLSAAERSLKEANEALERIESKQAGLDKEIADILSQAEADAESEKQRLLALAEQDVARIHQQASAEIENMRDEGKRELRKFLADLAVSKAESVIKETMTDQERAKLFADFSTRVGAKA